MIYLKTTAVDSKSQLLAIIASQLVPVLSETANLDQGERTPKLVAACQELLRNFFFPALTTTELVTNIPETHLSDYAGELISKTRSVEDAIESANRLEIALIAYGRFRLGIPLEGGDPALINFAEQLADSFKVAFFSLVFANSKLIQSSGPDTLEKAASQTVDALGNADGVLHRATSQVQLPYVPDEPVSGVSAQRAELVESMATVAKVSSPLPRRAWHFLSKLVNGLASLVNSDTPTPTDDTDTDD